MRRSLLLILLAVSLATPATALDRCESLRQEVRRAHFYYLGLDYPWRYGIGQLQQESNCRNVLSRDGVGSEGYAQITWKWWGKHLAKAGIPEVRTTRNNLRAQAFIMKDAWGQARGRLWVAYQIYNGGRLVLKEIDRAGILCWEAAKQECRRKIITFNNGQQISACDINYDYSKKVYEYGERYGGGATHSKFIFW